MKPTKNAVTTSNYGISTPENTHKSDELFSLSEYISRFLDNSYVIVFMAILTVWSLFCVEMKVYEDSDNSDSFYDIFLFSIFIIFIVEMLLSIYSKPEYIKWPRWRRGGNESYFKICRRGFGSFYFWLDLLGTTSFIFEIVFIWQPFMQFFSRPALTAANSFDRGSSTGRALRLALVFSLVRVERLFKYFSIVSKPEEEKRNKINYNLVAMDDDEDDTYIHQSHVGSKMTDLTNQRVLVLVIGLLVAIPALLITPSDTTQDLAVRMLFNMAYNNYTNSSYYEDGLILALDNIYNTTNVVQINFITSTTNTVVYQDIPSHIRSFHKITYYQETSSGTTPYFKVSLIFNATDMVIANAAYSLLMSFFFLLLLVVGAFVLWYDINKLVINPVKKLVSLVEKISKDPLADYKDMGTEEGFREGFETTILLTNILKIVRLMRVGFGEAGASVIADNLQRSSGGTLTLVGPGKEIYSIFGFCDIRQFTDTTECLQEEVMVFVNRIASILHGIVVQCSGQANKNIGDAFLLTWKIDSEKHRTEEDRMKLADQALIAFLRTLVELIRQEQYILNFSKVAHERLEKRFRDYSVRIGCGLHYGWAIEGAIGSQRKIDASYLSPHVNFTEYLESSTKTYGVPILMSEAFYGMLSSRAQSCCRQVDRILRSESQGPLGLYTYDADLSINFADLKHKRIYPQGVRGPRPAHLHRSHIAGRLRSLSIKSTDLNINTASSIHTINTNNQDTPKSNMFYNYFSSSGLHRNNSINSMSDEETANRMNNPIIDGTIVSNTSNEDNSPDIKIPVYRPEIWEEDEDLIELRHIYGIEFSKAWTQGMEHYIKGQWNVASTYFKQTLKMSHDIDGPSKYLLKCMSETNNEAPDDWMGYNIEGTD